MTQQSHAERDETMIGKAAARFLPSRTDARKKTRRGVLIALQLVLLVGIYEAGCLVAKALPIDLPGNIVGMALLLTLLATRVLKHKHVGAACDYLIDNMSIFFVPAGVGIMGCFSMLEDQALKFAFVCVATTIIVFLATSYTVIAVQRLMERRARRAVRTSDGAGLEIEA